MVLGEKSSDAVISLVGVMRSVSQSDLGLGMDDQLIDAENSSQDDENDHGEGYSAHVTSIGFQDLEIAFSDWYIRYSSIPKIRNYS